MEEEKKKTTFLFVFLTYLPMFLLKFRSGELIGCGINFRIQLQRVPTRHTFDNPSTGKTTNTCKNMMMTSSSCFFRYFLFFRWWGPSKFFQVGTRWMRNLILHPTSSPDRNLSKNTKRYVENTNKKVVFLWYLSPNLY